MQDPKTVQFIKDAQLQGKSKEEIYSSLLQQGIKLEVIEENFKASNEEATKEEAHKKTVYILVTIGAVLIGAGIFSFIASNWSLMDKSFKVFVIIFFMLASYGLGWYLKEYKKLAKSGMALFFLGSIIYGAGIFLIGQMFNIDANWPDAFILWMLGTIALAYSLESSSFFLFAGLLGIVAVFGHTVGVFERFSGFGTSLFLIIVSIAASLITAIFQKSKVAEEYKNIY